MTLSDLHVATTTRVADELNEGRSNSYAEMRRMKGIRTAAESEKETIFLNDENDNGLT